MSEKTAELWAQASELEKAPAELEKELAELNQQIGWNREDFNQNSFPERTQLPADD